MPRRPFQRGNIFWKSCQQVGEKFTICITINPTNTLDQSLQSSTQHYQDGTRSKNSRCTNRINPPCDSSDFNNSICTWSGCSGARAASRRRRLPEKSSGLHQPQYASRDLELFLRPRATRIAAAGKLRCNHAGEYLQVQRASAKEKRDRGTSWTAQGNRKLRCRARVRNGRTEWLDKTREQKS